MNAKIDGAKNDAPPAVGAKAVVTFVREHYELGATLSGEAFAIPRSGARLPVMLGSRGGALRDEVTRRLFDETGSVPGSKAVDDGFRVVIAQARNVDTRTELHLRVAQTRTGLVLDLGQPGSAICVVIEPHGWHVEDNPPPGVLFRRTSATRELPEPTQGGSLDELRELLDFTPDDSRWLLARGWLVACLFPSIPRPMLLMLGAPGSAKTTRARFVVSTVDPRTELGSNFGKNITDDQVKALGRYLTSYDNITGASEAISDHLCRLVTGDEIDKRTLYSDNDMTTISYRRTGAMTAVSMPPLRSDAFERVVLVQVDRIEESQRRSESQLRADFDRQHPSILGALCDAVASTLARLDAVKGRQMTRPRMADYYDVLMAHDSGAALAYKSATVTAMEEAAEADPFVSAVAAWVEGEGEFTGTAAQAHNAADAHRRFRDPFATVQWWPKSAARFSAMVTAEAGEPLRALGVTVEKRKSNGVRLLSFRHRHRVDAAQRVDPDWAESTLSTLPSTLSFAQVSPTFGPERVDRVGTRGGFSTPNLEGEEREEGGEGMPAETDPGDPGGPAPASDGGAIPLGYALPLFDEGRPLPILVKLLVSEHRHAEHLAHDLLHAVEDGDLRWDASLAEIVEDMRDGGAPAAAFEALSEVLGVAIAEGIEAA